MKILERIRSLTKVQIVFLIAMLWCLVSILIFLIDPAARRGPLGFGPPASMTTFRSRDSSFSILYPQNWIAVDTPQGTTDDAEAIAVIVVSGRQLANVVVARQTFSGGSITDVVHWGQARAARHLKYTPVSLGPQTDNNLGGFIHEYTWLSYPLHNITSRCQDAYMFNKGIGYDLSFCSRQQDWQSLEDVFMKMRQSFALLEGSQ